MKGLPRRYVPNLYRMTVINRCDALCVRTPGQRISCGVLPWECAQGLPSICVPNTNCMIYSQAEELVIEPHQAHDLIGVSMQDRQGLRSCHIPNLNIVPTAGRQLATVCNPCNGGIA